MFRFTFCLILVLAKALIPLGSVAREDASTPDPGWPCELTEGNSTVTLYQPQIESWENYRYLVFRMAASIQLTEDDDRWGS